MIGKIQPPNPNLLKAVEYNQKKMDGKEGIRDHESEKELEEIENGHVLATRNVPEDSTLLDEFDRLKFLNDQKTSRGSIRNLAFHMSVNPSDTDRELSEEEAVSFIDELMEGLGYKDQPYRIYKHTDIERMHYHVVSCRAGQDGKKINDSYERLVLRAKLKELAPKYGYTVILNKKELAQERRKQKKEMQNAETAIKADMAAKPSKTKNKKNTESRQEPNEDTKKKAVPPFSRKSEISTTQQFTDAFNEAMLWNYSTFEQIQALMLRRYNMLIELEGSISDEKLVISGTDATGKPITPMVKDEDLGIRMLERIREKCDGANMSARKEQKKRLEGLARAAAAKASSFDEFRTLMEKKGVYVVVSWSRNGDPFGVTWLDRATKCAWKGSETAADFKWLKGVAESKGWTFTKDKQQQTIEKRAAMPSRKKTITRTKVSGLETPRPAPAQQSREIRQSGAASLINALSQIRGGHHMQEGRDAHGKGRSLWDQAIEEAEREERERRKNESGPEL